MLTEAGDVFYDAAKRTATVAEDGLINSSDDVAVSTKNGIK